MADASALDDWLHSVRPAWMLDAACAEHDEIEWGPKGDRVSAAAATVCAACLVQDECADYGLRHDVVGIWGGTTTADRKALAATLGIAPERITPPPAPTGDQPCPSCGRLQSTRRVCGTCRARASRARHATASLAGRPA